jgi:hypothetical protein
MKTVAGTFSVAVRTLRNPDVELIATDQIVATADSIILHRCLCWFNLAREVIDAIGSANVVQVSAPPTA